MQTTRPVHVIAEMACSHDGSLTLAKTIVDAASLAGASAIQFQIWQTTDLMVPHHPDFEKLKRLELAPSQWRELVGFARDRFAQDIIACVYDPATVDFAHSLGIEFLKIHAGELNNFPLLERAARVAKRVDLCIGSSRLDEIQQALAMLVSCHAREIWLMYGFQAFPTPIEEAGLEEMLRLKQLFGLPMGYQDHSDAESDCAFWIPAAAVGMGIDILEKHLTHDRSLKGADHEAALNPDEFSKFVRMVRSIESARGLSVSSGFSERQKRYRTVATKTVVARRDLPEGRLLSHDDIAVLRSPDQGLTVARASELIGRVTRRRIPALLPIQFEDLL